MKIEDIEKRLNNIDSEQKELRSLLENKFKNTKSSDIKDRIFDFKSACEDLEIKTHGDAYTLLKLKNKLLREVPIDQCDDVGLQLMVCIHALNEGHIFDWSNSNEYKYFPYFQMNKKPGSGFVDSDCSGWYSDSVVSSRLAYKSEELAIYGGKTFEFLYYEYMQQNP